MKGKRELDNRLTAIGNTQNYLHRLQLQTVAGAKAKVPRKTGHLGRSIVPGPVDAHHAAVEARTPYAAAVEYGTKAHEIRPKNAQALAFPASSSGRRLSGRRRTNSGRLIFAKVVHHPGTRKQPYLVPAAKEAVGKSAVDIIDVWNDAA